MKNKKDKGNPGSRRKKTNNYQDIENTGKQ